VKPKLALLLVVATLVWSVAPAGAARLSGVFTDDDTSVHEPAIEAIAAQGITRGCNPPTNDRFCPREAVTRGQMAAFLRRAFSEQLTAGPSTTFTDIGSSEFAGDIEWLAATGVTRGCNPPSNSRFCPGETVTRGQMAAFLTRALGLTDRGDFDFVDDNGSVFEADIERIAQAGITVGCNPPDNDRFCPSSPVTREQMASFLARALELPQTPPVVNLATGWWCSKDGLQCSGTATSGPNRRMTVVEGWDHALPFAAGEDVAFRAENTRFELRIDGVTRSGSPPAETSTATVATRRWMHTVVTPASGSFAIEGRWYWQDELVRRTRVVVSID
jgi:hypothetical protein